MTNTNTDSYQKLLEDEDQDEEEVDVVLEESSSEEEQEPEVDVVLEESSSEEEQEPEVKIFPVTQNIPLKFNVRKNPILPNLQSPRIKLPPEEIPIPPSLVKKFPITYETPIPAVRVVSIRPEFVNASEVKLLYDSSDEEEEDLDYTIPQSSQGGTKWYYKFVRIPEHLTDKYPVLVKDGISNEKVFKMFSVFYSHRDMYKYIMAYPVPDRHFYIMIKEDEPCRIYLDYDLSPEIEFSQADIVEKIKKDIDKFYKIAPAILQKVFGVSDMKHVYIFNSSFPGKISMHVEFDAYSVSDNREIYPFAEALRNAGLPFDNRVYTKNRQWRLPLSSKIGSTNIKRLLEQKEDLPKNRFFITDVSGTYLVKSMTSFFDR